MSGEPPPGFTVRRSVWMAAAGGLLSLLLLAWVLSDLSWAELAREIRQTRLAPMLLAVAVATSTFGLRLVRWRYLLRHDADQPLPTSALWHAIALGFTANNILPFRAGELIRTYAVSRLAPVPFTAALASIAVERVFDALTVVLLLTVALFSTDLPDTITIAGQAASMRHAATVAGALSSALLLAALAVVIWPLAAERAIRALVPWPRMAEHLVRLVEAARQGMTALRSPSRLGAVVVWSLVLWLVNAASFALAFRAFDLDVDFSGALLLQGLLVFGIAVPAAPGFVGVFEAVIKAVLLLYAVPDERAAAYALVYHATTWLPITLLGAWSLMRSSLGVKDLEPGSMP